MPWRRREGVRTYTPYRTMILPIVMMSRCLVAVPEYTLYVSRQGQEIKDCGAAGCSAAPAIVVKKSRVKRPTAKCDIRCKADWTDRRCYCTARKYSSNYPVTLRGTAPVRVNLSARVLPILPGLFLGPAVSVIPAERPLPSLARFTLTLSQCSAEGRPGRYMRNPRN